ncbi:hypothetical protein M0R45_016753 [Rubus argutus]|uniref:Uncharacterized protein n=1 Tax=Rubus argutus TaxID=59490 RepID=A0AAW1XW67_RUBAR
MTFDFYWYYYLWTCILLSHWCNILNDQLKLYPEIYEGYVPMAYDEYLEKMSRSGEWAIMFTLQAAADLYGVKIFVITSFKDTCYIEILPSAERVETSLLPELLVIVIMLLVICLSFWAEVHYNSIYSEGVQESPKHIAATGIIEEQYYYDP